MTIEQLSSLAVSLERRVKELDSDLAETKSELRDQQKKIERLESSLREAHNEISHLDRRSQNP